MCDLNQNLITNLAMLPVQATHHMVVASSSSLMCVILILLKNTIESTPLHIALLLYASSFPVVSVQLIVLSVASELWIIETAYSFA